MSAWARNERIDEIADLARTADEVGFSHMTLVDEPYLSREVHIMSAITAGETPAGFASARR